MKKNKIGKHITRENVAILVSAAMLAGTQASAAGEGFDIGAAAIAATAATTILGIAAAGAGLKATGIGIKVAFRWAERLLKG